MDYSLTTLREKVGSLTYRRKTAVFRKTIEIKWKKATQQLMFGKLNVNYANGGV